MDQKEALFEYCLRLGDTSLVLGHRLSEWCGHGPVLEEDIALANIALDLIGQARILLTYAGEVEGKGRDEDALAYRRDAWDFRNVLLAEQPNGDFAYTTVRQYLVSTYQFHLYSRLVKSADKTLSGFAEKALKEVAYHVRHAGDWLLRLGDGTEESHQRAQDAVDDLWVFTDDLFFADEVEAVLAAKGIVPGDVMQMKEEWLAEVNGKLAQATLTHPDVDNFMRTGGKQGRHSEYLGHLLAEMQFLPRAYPDATW
jgi:ring-1,2-phenylacetyl-CoA epoxidase subunit PaaC